MIDRCVVRYSRAIGLGLISRNILSRANTSPELANPAVPRGVSRPLPPRKRYRFALIRIHGSSSLQRIFCHGVSTGIPVASNFTLSLLYIFNAVSSCHNYQNVSINALSPNREQQVRLDDKYAARKRMYELGYRQWPR